MVSVITSVKSHPDNVNLTIIPNFLYLFCMKSNLVINNKLLNYVTCLTANARAECPFMLVRVRLAPLVSSSLMTCGWLHMAANMRGVQLEEKYHFKDIFSNTLSLLIEDNPYSAVKENQKNSKLPPNF